MEMRTLVFSIHKITTKIELLLRENHLPPPPTLPWHDNNPIMAATPQNVRMPGFAFAVPPQLWGPTAAAEAKKIMAGLLNK